MSSEIRKNIGTFCSITGNLVTSKSTIYNGTSLIFVGQARLSCLTSEQRVWLCLASQVIPVWFSSHVTCDCLAVPYNLVMQILKVN